MEYEIPLPYGERPLILNHIDPIYAFPFFINFY